VQSHLLFGNSRVNGFPSLTLMAKKLSGPSLATNLTRSQLAKPDERVLMTMVTTMRELAALAVTWGSTRPQQPQVNPR